MDARGIVLWPVVTEKSMDLMDDKKHIFGVFVSTTEIQVRNAAKEIFDVEVKNVNIMNVHGREKRAGRYIGKTARRRKAIVILTEDSSDIKISNDNKEN